MNTQEYHLLLVTNGFEGTRPALDYGLWLASKMKAAVTLLGVAEPADAYHPVRPLVEETAKRLDSARLPYQVEIRVGHTEEAVSEFVKQGDYLLVISPLGRPPLRRWLMGRSFRHIMAEIASPILYVPVARIPVKNILICIGGLGYGVTAENLGFRLAEVTEAGVTLLNVVPPIDLDYPTARAVKENWEHLIDTDTPPGRALRQGLKSAEAARLLASVKVRHGNVVHEILDEIKRGDYDMVCMGSAYSAHSLRHLYMPNVTAEVAEAANCPILTVRYAGEPQGV